MVEVIEDALLYEKNGHIVTLTMNQPEIRNPMGDPRVIPLWQQAADKINDDQDVRCVILTGAGKHFSTGGNVKNMGDRVGDKGSRGSSALDARRRYRTGVHRIVRAVRSIELPVIAAVNGAAVGLGCDITCLCDMRIAADNARFGVTFLKLGLNPGDGGAFHLQKIVGMARASEMFYTGELIDAETARDWGLVGKVVPLDQLLAEANDLANRVAKQPPGVLRMTKVLMRTAQTNELDTVLEMSAAMQGIAHHTDDHVEAINAFFEKRPGEYTGR
ncbi:MAG: crotonase/enoyl-CoA hydratase family protein [Pseudomonadales bacterium]|nr:crotonase/enoyl-CoA hydratase family protein [Pseudomonadales bacterium]